MAKFEVGSIIKFDECDGWSGTAKIIGVPYYLGYDGDTTFRTYEVELISVYDHDGGDIVILSDDLNYTLFEYEILGDKDD